MCLVYILWNFSWFRSTGAIQTVSKGRHRKTAPSLHDTVCGYGSAGTARAQSLSYDKNRNFIFLIKCNCWKYLERPKFMPQAQRRECSFSLPKNISKFANYLNHLSQTTLKENYATTKKKIHTATRKIDSCFEFQSQWAYLRVFLLLTCHWGSLTQWLHFSTGHGDAMHCGME